MYSFALKLTELYCQTMKINNGSNKKYYRTIIISRHYANRLCNYK